MQRGDIVFVDFGTGRSSEVSLKRPAVVMTNNFANQYADVVTVIPLTSQNLASLYPMHLFLSKERTGLGRDSKAQVELLAHVKQDSILRLEGQVPTDLMAELDSKLKEHLALQ
jgi:mRNA interferase MazF